MSDTSRRSGSIERAAPPDIGELADWIVSLFRGAFLNSSGLVSRDFPTTARTILDNLDDLAPFLVYFGQAEFLLEQARCLSPGSFEAELPIGNVLHSYKIDEYLGGLNAIFRATGDGHVHHLLLDAIDRTLRCFLVGDDYFVESFDLSSGRRSPYFSPWSAGLLETFLELADLRPDLPTIVASVMDGWCRHPFFLATGLFPFRGSRSMPREAAARATARLRLWCGEAPHFGLMPGEGGGGRMRTALKTSPAVYRARRTVNEWARSGLWVQLMKSNTTPAFTMVALHKLTGDAVWRERLLRWIDAALGRLGCGRGVRGAWRPGDPSAVPTLVAGFIMIDVLCDAFWHIEQAPRLIEAAERIALACLSWRWHNGLIPMTPDGRWDHLDGQVDFAVALRRLADLAGKGEYREAARNLMMATFVRHRSPEGLVTHVDEKGDVLRLPRNTVDPKYNGLALKGLINLRTMDEPLYGNTMLMDLFKDR